MRGGTVCVVGNPLGWEIQGIEPTLRSQHCFAIVPVAIHQGLQIGLVIVRVRLRTDQGAIQSQVNLFDDGVSQIHAGPAEGTKLHARKNFCVFYPIELKLCTMIELFIPNNRIVFVFSF